MNKLAILVGGGPAPGINSVIGAATIRARLGGLDVVGIRDGFEWIMQGDIEQTMPLTIESVSRIHFRGGSTLGTARANPTKDVKLLDTTLDSFKRLGVSKLITIGGDDTAYSAMTLERRSNGALRVRPRAQDHRQRPVPARPRRHVRLPVGAALRRGDRQEPDGGREDHVPLVLRGRDGTKGRAPGTRDRQGCGQPRCRSSPRSSSRRSA